MNRPRKMTLSRRLLLLAAVVAVVWVAQMLMIILRQLETFPDDSSANVLVTNTDDEYNSRDEPSPDDLTKKIFDQVKSVPKVGAVNFDDVEVYLDSNPGLPLLLVCHDRPDRLRETLKSLFQVRGVRKENILVAQDGRDSGVIQVLDDFGMTRVHREEQEMLPDEASDPGMAIAQHYKFSLSSAIEHFRGAPGIIIVEDDFRFSPDFLEYFSAVAPAVQRDPSLWTASAFNDNGQQGTVFNKTNVLRTEHFPGLGWLLLRSVWNEIREDWPRSHWDWFMRNPSTSKGRDALYPEISRVYHTGSVGSFMNEEMHKKYFEGIVYNEDPDFRWPKNFYLQVMLSSYLRRISDMILKGVHVRNGAELFEKVDPNGRAKIIWYSHDPYPSQELRIQALASEFRIWHQVMRGSRQGLHELYYNGHKVLFINIFNPKTGRKRPKSMWFSGFAKQSDWILLKPERSVVFKPKKLLIEILSAKAGLRNFGPSHRATQAPKVKVNGVETATVATRTATQAPKVKVNGVETATVVTEENLSKSDVVRYLEKHASFPIALLCYNRPKELRSTITSLLEARNVKRENVLVLQDGSDAAVASVVQSFDLKLVQRTGSAMGIMGKDPGYRIASHYKFALQKAMDEFPSAPGVLIVEDDFFFSPDFMEYFVHVAPAVDEDPTLWAASAWNDNGFPESTSHNNSKLLRTNYFPGLGWLLLRDIWEEIKTKWPSGGWDWYMRDPSVSKHREVVYPEVNRVYHAGSVGSYMSLPVHHAYFETIVMNKDESFHWPAGRPASVMLDTYNSNLLRLVQSGIHIKRGVELLPGPHDIAGIAKIVWYVYNPMPANEHQFKPLAKELNIWHQVLRSSHEGINQLYYKGQLVLLINVFEPQHHTGSKSWFKGYERQSPWVRYRPAAATVFEPQALALELTAAN
eukprot:CAMPEP_0184547052 /NCGR_PEP_ID=MMETSP0199_2-20130426/5331_1 /TAXON_ID=1112570 /ORGANISM="Thraustochytrium sp., Strain LLF1b" /LENGTH=916 /DNA_ID=CAMNT_0026941501 /DNA_START=18 /DNA_END=2768 /DNA_ORIENTATION=+